MSAIQRAPEGKELLRRRYRYWRLQGAAPGIARSWAHAPGKAPAPANAPRWVKPLKREGQ